MKMAGKPEIDRDSYYMGIALLSARLSKQSFKNGACLINDEGKIVGVGCNNFPDTVNDNLFLTVENSQICGN